MTTKTTKFDLLICGTCGNWQTLEVTAWVNANTLVLIQPHEAPSEYCWCPSCKRPDQPATLTRDATPEIHGKLLLELDVLSAWFQVHRPDGLRELAELIQSWSGNAKLDVNVVAGWLAR